MDFNDIIEFRTTEIKAILTEKACEYASDKDRFHNFNRAGEMLRTSPEKALVGMMVKHVVSVFDMVDWIDSHPEKITTDLVDEKCGDLCNYTILLEGLFKQKIAKQKIAKQKKILPEDD